MFRSGILRELGVDFRAGSTIRNLALAVAVSAASVGFSGGSAQASGSHLQLGALTIEPSGASDLCMRYSWACAATPASVQLNRSAFSEISRINRSINRSVRAVSDSQLYGVSDFWAYPSGGAGDCEDFALAKKRELVARGFPANRLLLATVHSRRTGPHAVLVLRLDEGDYVLDNLTNEILPWNATGYAFLRIQSPSAPGNWHTGFANRS
jgi:predicted transglutaminase-like cysteine proteinase